MPEFEIKVVADHRGSSRDQSYNATQIAYAGEDVLRATVHFDQFYDFQSQATVAVWRDGWQEIIRLGGTDVEEPDATLPKLYALAALVLNR